MDGNGLIAIGLIVSILGIVAALWLNIHIVKRKVGRWDSNSTIWFVMSIGNFGIKQVDMWKRRAGYDEGEASLIIRYQTLCLLEMPLGFIAYGIVLYKVLSP
jgi:hypothetical protein